MSINTQQKNKKYTLTIKSVDNEQVFIVVVMNESDHCMKDFSIAYTDIVECLKKHGIHILHERIFGSNTYFNEVNNIRAGLLAVHGMTYSPYTFLNGNPYWGQGIAGIHIHGVILKKESSPLWGGSFEKRKYGHIWDNGKEEYLFLHNIECSTAHDYKKYDEFSSMFEKSQNILSENGFHFKDVIRSWIYFENILSEYDIFNQARTNFFKKYGLLSDNGHEKISGGGFMPASTGIGCGNPMHGAAVMDIMAVKKKSQSALSVRDETGIEQESAYKYGSAFSRAVLLSENAHKQVLLSGTASINQAGKTVYLNNIGKQIGCTFKVIKALIEANQVKLENMCESTVFLKKAEYYKTYRNYIRKNELSDLPAIVVIADVCRDELLFEMDATFIV